MQLPASNLTPDSQPWGREIEKELEDRESADLALADKLDEINHRYSSLLSDYNQVLVELHALYAATGNTYPPAAPEPPVEIPPAPVIKEYYSSAAWSKTWGSSSAYTGSGTDTNATYLYQGSNPENKVGMFGFDTSSVQNKYIISGGLWMANINSPYQPVFSADLGTHSNGSAPGSKPGRVNPFSVGWARGEAKWVPLERWVLDGISNGSITGFTVGASGASDPNYAYFQGVGQASPPVLKLSYNQ